MNHKRKRPKHQRAGCLMCKPHKDERDSSPNKVSVMRKLQANLDHLCDAIDHPERHNEIVYVGQIAFRVRKPQDEEEE